MALVIAVLAVIAGFGPGMALQAAWPGQNGRIFFSGKVTGETRSRICSVAPDGTGLQVLTNGVKLDDRQPTVSRDGTKVAFVRGGRVMPPASG